MKKLIFTVLTAVMVIVVVEAVGTGLFYVTHGEWPSAFAQRAFPNVRLTIPDHPYLPYYASKGRAGHIRFNSLGGRGREPETPKQRIRVVCFGGSTTFDGKTAWERTWPGMQETAGGSVVEHHHPESRGLLPPLEALEDPGGLPRGVWFPEDDRPRRHP